ncbi:polyprenyl synthetase family protein [Candidatus Formimonas warabiya]|uniref:Polyprenyl synthetase family protein n=1 Tax=Formimonas warabiya TaxID=1761012 RepID=A0A3G1KUB9_FORW1|nr:polyprenyl synthetase family protein [Candidatus Formimonas warabiya]ATW26014.1 hypothetical protein DCMF_15625 [Candidatus Formimonas warabiya]
MEQIYTNQPWTTQQTKLGQLVPEITQVESLLHEVIGSGTGTIVDMCTYLLESGGKRLRPLLVILSGKTVSSPSGDRLVAAGAAAELIHMASLVHDDIIDQSLVRRGQPSLYALWGQKNAVLAGDFLFAKAFDLLVSAQLHATLKLMVTAIQEMCQGEITQADQLFRTSQLEEDYFHKIYQKTGKFLAACCQAGGIISHAGEARETALQIYGTNLGYVFQIIDDLLDFDGHSEILGKPVCQDLAQGNLTLPVLYLLKHPEHGPQVREIIKTRRLDKVNCAMIIDLLNQTGLLDQARNVAAHCAGIAKAELAKLPQGMSRNMLEYIVDQALERTS